jgi:hypothetical protein
MICFMQRLKQLEQRLVSRHSVRVYVLPLAFMNHLSGYLSRPEQFGFTWFFGVATMKSVYAHLSWLLGDVRMYVRA